MNKKAFILGVILGAIAMRIFLVASASEEHDHEDHAHSDDVHVHADFMMVLDDKKIDLTQDKYQSKVGDVKHADAHLHDNQGNILHRHAEEVTLADLINSIGFTLNNDCINTDDEKLCTDDNKALILFVNGEEFSPIDSYIINDEDQTLLYYGIKDSPKIADYLNSLTDEACIYSGTCPERGTPPPEACGLTCEVDASELYPE